MFSVWSKGDELLDERLRKFNSNQGVEFAADSDDSRGYHYHGAFLIPLTGARAADGSIAFDRIREALVEIARTCAGS